jgi:hypothetical protein
MIGKFVAIIFVLLGVAFFVFGFATIGRMDLVLTDITKFETRSFLNAVEGTLYLIFGALLVFASLLISQILGVKKELTKIREALEGKISVTKKASESANVALKFADKPLETLAQNA